jgi:hypothetical protein
MLASSLTRSIATTASTILVTVVAAEKLGWSRFWRMAPQFGQRQKLDGRDINVLTWLGHLYCHRGVLYPHDEQTQRLPAYGSHTGLCGPTLWHRSHSKVRASGVLPAREQEGHTGSFSRSLFQGTSILQVGHLKIHSGMFAFVFS